MTYPVMVQQRVALQLVFDLFCVIRRHPFSLELVLESFSGAGDKAPPALRVEVLLLDLAEQRSLLAQPNNGSAGKDLSVVRLKRALSASVG